jgi:hypothetical protein
MNKTGEYTMVNKNTIKIGQAVKAIFRKNGRHTIVGIIFDIYEDSKSICKTWISIHVTGGDECDSHVQWMVSHRINCLVPLCDILEAI